MSSCRRQSDAFKCLKAYAKCLPPLSKQVLIALVQSRQKFNKRICTEKPTETAQRLIELSQCMLGSKEQTEKGTLAEMNAITLPESIVNAKIDSGSERLKYSCCSVAKSRKEFIDLTSPQCRQHSQMATELADSYLAETTGMICPDFDSKQRHDCDKLPKLPTSNKMQSRHFISPTLRVIQMLT